MRSAALHWVCSTICIGALLSIDSAQYVFAYELPKAESLRQNASVSQPNIVVVLCDDLGYGDLECFGHPAIKTPNLNALAEQGWQLTDCYSAAPVCSPSRVGLLTGRSPNRAGVYDWIPGSNGQARPDSREQVHMRANEIAVPALLKQAGYDTCLAGKWHCNSRFNHESQPQPDAFGFDHWLATQNNASPSHLQPNNFVRNGESVGPVDQSSCQFVVTETLEWLGNRKEKETPFFCYLAFHEPHEPVASPEELVARYRSVARNEDEAHYFANVANVDEAVGRLVEGLKSLGVYEETLIVFTSDNGPETLKRYARAERSYGQPGPLRGMKLHTTEAGIRVAGIMHWPGRLEPGKQISQPVSSLDLLPTFCDLAGIEPPSELALDGTSLVPLFEGDALNRSKPLLWIYYNAINDQRVAMRSGRWKVLAKLDEGELKKLSNVNSNTEDRVKQATLSDLQVFDMQNDLEEEVALGAKDDVPYQELVELLQKNYHELVEDSHVWEVRE